MKETQRPDRFHAVLPNAPRVYGLIQAQCRNVGLASAIAGITLDAVRADLVEYADLEAFEAAIFRIAMDELKQRTPPTGAVGA